MRKDLNERPERYSKSKNRRHKYKKEPRKPLIEPSMIPYGIIILAYFFVVTFTPNWMALDTNATKFMTLSFLNLLAFGYLWTRPDIKGQPGVLMRFFDTRAGLAFGLFLVVVLLSFTQAINILESVLHFTKLFSVFMATFIIAVILMRDMRYVKMVVVLGALLLVFDSLSVFYYIQQYIIGEFSRITDIKSVYSNKNILASAIFVKIPFALYLWMFDGGRLKILGLFGLFTGLLATFFMATRGFYVGTIVVTLVFVLYCGYNYFRDKEIRHITLLGGYIGALVLALVLFSVVRSNLYPSTASRHTQAIGTQLATIQDDAQESNRINAWFWSFDIIKENPILGVGTGNWKLNILEHENQVNTGYIYLYKAHNDFIENTVETGIPGGLIYILMFVFIFWSLIRAYLYKDRNTLRYRHLFLAGFGMMFYGFDAFFNFPMDRPEIQMLFALYMAVGVVATLKTDRPEGEEQVTASAGDLESEAQKQSRRPQYAKIMSAVFVVLMLGSAYILTVNYESSKLQRVVYQDIMRGELNRDSDKFLEGFPFIPNVSIWGEAISSLTARYLLQEDRHEEVIELLRPDARVNPWDGRREFFMATAFHNLEMKDSALVYSKKSYEVKPHYFRNVHLMTTLLQEKDREDEVGPILDGYLAHDKSNDQAYLYATSFFNRQGELEHAWNHIDTAYQAMPRNERIEQQYNFLQHRKFVAPHQDLYRTAAEYYNDNQYAEALPYLDEFIEKTPFDQNVYRMRAFSNYHLENHEETIDDINYVMEQGESSPVLVNLRGVCYRAIGDNEAACEDFRAAMEAGNASGETNFNNFCAEEEDGEAS